MLGPESFDDPHVWDSDERSRRMLNKFTLRGRRQLRASNDINDPPTLARYLFRDGG